MAQIRIIATVLADVAVAESVERNWQRGARADSDVDSGSVRRRSDRDAGTRQT
jgi:hypothetical protein